MKNKTERASFPLARLHDCILPSRKKPKIVKANRKIRCMTWAVQQSWFGAGKLTAKGEGMFWPNSELLRLDSTIKSLTLVAGSALSLLSTCAQRNKYYQQLHDAIPAHTQNKAAAVTFPSGRQHQYLLCIQSGARLSSIGQKQRQMAVGD